MAKTFSLRRREIVEKELGVEELRERWPALFTVDEINAEFLRITTVPLQTRFLASLDKHYSKLIELIRRKGGVIREKTQEILKVLDLTAGVHQHSGCKDGERVGYTHYSSNKAMRAKPTTRMGFEPTRAEHNGLAVHRLNHSATSSKHKVAEGQFTRTPPSNRAFCYSICMHRELGGRALSGALKALLNPKLSVLVR
ncbi:hypothetical protein WMY93_012778 [Mugilogobius chulae]|uniref:Uncharacterized protein n=1 Tax=Mugilogobius chulae TaxID=88201 RepID=A0AAW0P261_9GOBI